MIATVSRITTLLIALGIFAVHYTLEFFAWALHPGNLAIPSSHSALPWSILSFPLFFLVGGRIATEFFDIELLANSLIWSGCLTPLMIMAFRKIRVRSTNPRT